MKMRASITFLRKVAAGEVMKVRRYSPRRGGSVRFIGGEATAQFHAGAGLITMPYIPDLGRPALAALTEAGKAMIADADRRKQAIANLKSADT